MKICAKKCRLYVGIILSSLMLINSLVACTVDSKNNSAESDSFTFGILANLYQHGDDPSHFSDLFSHAEYLKVESIREVIAMDWIMPARGTYDEVVLAHYDHLIDTAHERNIEIIGLIDYENSWSTEDYYAPYEEQHFQDYADFVSYIVNRYKGKIRYWEIGNEPEVAQYWKPEANAYDYAQLLKYGYEAAKQADPDCVVIGFSGFSSSLDFLKEIFDNDGLSYMDILGLHPYCYSDPTYKSIFEISDEYAAIDEIRSMMIDYEKDTPIWVTEVGYPTYSGEFGVSEQRQAEMLVRTFILLMSKEINHIFWATLINESDDLSDQETNFGLLNHDLSSKNAYFAYENLADLLSYYRRLEEIDIGNMCKAFLFRLTSDEVVLVAWTYDEIVNSEDGDVSVNKKTITMDLKGDVKAAFDIYKNDYEYMNAEGCFTFELTGSPVYIIGDYEFADFSFE